MTTVLPHHTVDNSGEQGLISVIIPCYNSEKHLRETIESVCKQTYPQVEIIIVDDGSNDQSLQIIAEHGSHITLIKQQNQGPYPARNNALKQSRGQFIAFLDADDLWDPSCLAKLHSALVTQDADLAYCGWQNFGTAAADSSPYIPPRYEEGDVISSFLKGCPWPIHAALTRRAVVDAVAGFSERRFSSMDYDFWLRIIAHTRHIVLVPEVLAYYRWHGQQISTVKWQQVLNAVNVRREFVTGHPEQVSHIEPEKLAELVNGPLLQEAYRAYWNRNLDTAQRLFRASLTEGIWRRRDLKYILPALLPTSVFQALISLSDKVLKGKQK